MWRHQSWPNLWRFMCFKPQFKVSSLIKQTFLWFEKCELIFVLMEYCNNNFVCQSFPNKNWTTTDGVFHLNYPIFGHFISVFLFNHQNIFVKTHTGNFDPNYLRKIERVMMLSNFERIHARVSEKIGGKNAIFCI